MSVICKYLGAHISKALSWSHHVDTLAANTNKKTPGFLKHHLSCAPKPVKLLINMALLLAKF